MNAHERAQALIGEFADDYLMVIRADGETTVAVSDPAWARAIFDQIEPAIERAEKDLKNAPSDRKHGPGSGPMQSGAIE